MPSTFDPNLDALLWNGRARDSHGTEKIYGVVPAIVVKIDDTKEKRHQQGAVQIRFPWLLDQGSSQDILPWARCVTFASGHDGDGAPCGWVSTPQMHDEVLVGFENGDIHRPYVIGQLWNPKTADAAGEGGAGGGGGGAGGAGQQGAAQQANQAAGQDGQAGEAGAEQAAEGEGEAAGDEAGGDENAEEAAEAHEFEVKAEVVDEEGRPIGDLRFELTGPQSHSQRGTVDASGAFQKGVPREGRYELKLFAPGTEPAAPAAPAAAQEPAAPAEQAAPAQAAAQEGPAPDQAAGLAPPPEDEAPEEPPPGSGAEPAPAAPPPEERRDTAEFLCAAGTVGRGFVPRDPQRYPGRIHAGQDISGPRGTAIHAAMTGTVIFSGQKTGYGNLIILKHPQENVTTAYAHLDARSAAQGAEVQGGQQIATMGNTAEGPAGSRGAVRQGMGVHLHFSIQRIPRGFSDAQIVRAFGSSYEERRDIRIEPRVWLREKNIRMVP